MRRGLPRARVLVAAATLLLALAAPASAREIEVDGDEALVRALSRLAPGDVLLIAPGTYRGGHYVRAKGTAKKRIEIRGADPERPPVFEGGGRTAFQLSDCTYVTLADVVVRGFALNGVNIDDGGTFETPAEGIVVERIVVEDTGPRGNHDGLKLSGLVDFRVRGCTFRGWGGSAIDMVGCRQGVVEDCRFLGKNGFSQSNGVQMKGGSTGILVHRSLFVDCGDRGVNLGGSTGLAYFRPEVTAYEAFDIEVAGNRFVRGRSAVGFVTADRSKVHHNTILYPERWVFRILQESEDERFGKCRNGVVRKNLVVFDDRVRSLLNIGPRTLPKTFVFFGNAWDDQGSGRQPRAPPEDRRSILRPKLEVVEDADGVPDVKTRDPRLKDVGAHAYVPAARGG